MSPKEAQRLLEALAQGVDPETGEELPPESPIHAPSIIRALYLGARALATQAAAEERRQPSPPKAGKPWTPDEERKLLVGYDAGVPVKRLAEIHERSRGGITARLARLGRIDERSEVSDRESRLAKPEDDQHRKAIGDEDGA
jgi:hypothetical protein